MGYLRFGDSMLEEFSDEDRKALREEPGGMQEE